jgi:hypothetical protein
MAFNGNDLLSLLQVCQGKTLCGSEADVLVKTKAGISCMDWFYNGIGSSCHADAGMPPMIYTFKDVCIQDGKQYQVFHQSCSGCGRAGLGLPDCRNPSPVQGAGLQVGSHTVSNIMRC